MAAVESPASYPESPMDEGDAVYPCKGCGDILEEGKAFELAGNRWHIDCFRCNTCNTLLDSDANLLLLGDGSLICNNCTYSCNACGNKIEDLAILTGDQAFCAACFRCRNCKRKIENLRYARTSQGIFCMRCHESLMERRRKKNKKPSVQQSSGPAVLDKSLPALPPNADPIVSLGSDGQEDTSPRTQQNRFNSISDGTRRDASPYDESRKENLTLPSSIYREGRVSNASSMAASDLDDEHAGFLPMAFDPTPPAHLAPPSVRVGQDNETPKAKEVVNSRDYFGARGSSRSHRELLREGTPSRSNSSDREVGGTQTSPKQSLQERNKIATRRKETADSQSSIPQATRSTSTNTLGSTEGFKLQDAPRTRKGSMRSENVLETPNGKSLQPHDNSGATPPTKEMPSPDSGINPFDDPKLATRHPARGDSLTASARKPMASLPDRSASEAAASNTTLKGHIRSGSAASGTYGSRLNGKSPDSPLRNNLDIPPRNAGRPSAPSKSVANDDFIAPRAPPPPPANGERRGESITSADGYEPASPARGHMHKPSLGEGFNMEEEMSRIIGRKDSTAGDSSPSVLRRVSNAVRHGRSFSDRGIPAPGRTPTSQHLEISSPLNPSNPASPSGQNNEAALLKAHLKRAQQRIAELESEKLGLQETMNNSGDLRQVNTELREKRSTMAFLDTQREMVVRELEVMTEHLSRAKDTGQPLDLPVLKTDILQDFAHSLSRLKDTLGAQIEDLVHKRNELTDEISNLIQVKDKGLQEFESLSSKNNQLNELNSQLVHNIQDMYKANRIPNGNSMVDLRSGSGSGSTPMSASAFDMGSVTSLQHEPETAQAQIVNAPQVVNIRKGAQPKRFNWKKGGKDVAKGVSGGLKRAFAVKDGQYDLNGMPIGPPQALSGANSDNSSFKTQGTESTRSGLGFFQKNGMKPGQLGTSLMSSSSTNLLASDPSILFGSELAARCDYEKRVLPAMVTRCVDEVEARGMDVEGIYRKSGGSGQVKQIQSGFERDGNFDISDPDLDIHAVTSCLKQYFRKLPNPLITFEVYDSVLEAAALGEEKRGIAMKVALGNLPSCHRDVLEYLVGHLARVVEKERVNLMTPLNLSVVFAPTIMRPASIEREMTDMQVQRDVVRALLDNRAMIFD